jgi:hypothetical protein
MDMDRAAGPGMGTVACGWHGWKAVNAVRLPGYRQVRRLSEIQTVRVGQSREYCGDGSAYQLRVSCKARWTLDFSKKRKQRIPVLFGNAH